MALHTEVTLSVLRHLLRVRALERRQPLRDALDFGEALKVDLAEYQALRNEMLFRSTGQQRAEQAALGTIGVAVALGSSLRSDPLTLSIVSIVASLLLAVLVFIYFTHRLKIALIGAYMTCVLRPRIERRLGEDALRWEEFWMHHPWELRLGRWTMADTSPALLLLELTALVYGYSLAPTAPATQWLTVVGGIAWGWGAWLAVSFGRVFEKARRP